MEKLENPARIIAINHYFLHDFSQLFMLQVVECGQNTKNSGAV